MRSAEGYLKTTVGRAMVRARDFHLCFFVCFISDCSYNCCSRCFSAGHLPHGMSVILCAPAAVAALASHHHERYLAVDAALGCVDGASECANVASTLKNKLVRLMRSTNMPSGSLRYCAKVQCVLFDHFTSVMRRSCCDGLQLFRCCFASELHYDAAAAVE